MAGRLGRLSQLADYDSGLILYPYGATARSKWMKGKPRAAGRLRPDGLGFTALIVDGIVDTLGVCCS